MERKEVEIYIQPQSAKCKVQSAKCKVQSAKVYGRKGLNFKVTDYASSAILLNVININIVKNDMSKSCDALAPKKLMHRTLVGYIAPERKSFLLGVSLLT